MALVGLLLLPAVATAAPESCGTCHPNVKTEYGESVHAKEFGCTGCHGGDATIESEEAHAAAKGYLGKPSRQAVPALCATCHADPTRMKAFGLPTDQYAQYQTSGHGVRLAQGDARVAVCSDCHGSHRILAPQQPLSPVSRRNISATCGRCHSDQPLMAEYRLPADQVDKFRRSVHGVALFDEEHRSAPTCATCHGPHGAVAPQVGSIRAVCGHCHERTREYFNQGPHRQAADDGKMSECVSCHGYHDTAAPDRALFDTTCPSCHEPGSNGVLAAQKLKTLLTQAQDSVATAHAEIARAAETSPTVARYRPRLQQGWAHFMEALPLQHALAVERVDDLTRSARSIAEDVRAAVHGAEQQWQLRYVLLGLAWVFILFTAGVAYSRKKERQRVRAQGESEPR
ncbi:MAG: hypothetical protein HY699_22155 [Deltaproteobacteria bacterium]|nr:hypothetical protein [Deltaproteobacteria bacterium]